MRKHFGTACKTKIEEATPLFDLRAGYCTLLQALEGKVCDRYAPGGAAADIAAMNDSLPGSRCAGATHDRR